MTPGAPHPFLRAGGGHWESHYKIKRSVRLRRSANPYLYRTPAANGVRTTQVLYAWVRCAEVGNEFFILSAGNNLGSSITQTMARFTFSGELEILHMVSDVVQWRLTSSAKYRDPANYRHIIVGIDTTQATASNRVLVGVNGKQLTAFSTASYPAQNSTTCFTDSAYAHAIGRNSALSFNHSDGYLAEHRLIDGYPTGINSDNWSFSALASVAGRICPEKAMWEPVPYIGSHGSQGWFLDFSDGSAATSAALGKDRSGNNNDWTPVNISVAVGVNRDWVSDTPTNRFPTFNALNPHGAGLTISNGALTVTTGGLGGPPYNYSGVIAIPIPQTGKWGARFTIGSRAATGVAAGLVKATAVFDGKSYAGTIDGFAYGDTGLKFDGANGVAYGNPVSVGEAIDVVFDADSGKAWFGIYNGVTTWQGGGDPVAGTNPSISGLTSRYFWYVEAGAAATLATIHADLGQQGYVPPTGVKTMCAVNEPEPVVVKSTDAFVSATDSGANIQATLAAKRAGWANYIEIFKRRDPGTNEGWRWRFSDDLANYLDTSNTAAKSAFPALGGTSYMGYALRVSTQNGVATGTFAHVNGVADTITDNLGTARKALFLRRESAGGGDWFFYHPDLTAGKLLYLNKTDAETVDSSISTVTANSFVAGAALPSGTYRWIGLASVPGFLAVVSHIGASDGAFDNLGHTPALMLVKRIDNVVGGAIVDSVRDPANTGNSTFLYPNSNVGESSSAGMDLVSGGAKMRTTDITLNAASGKYAVVSIAAFPSRYANAR